MRSTAGGPVGRPPDDGTAEPLAWDGLSPPLYLYLRPSVHAHGTRFLLPTSQHSGGMGPQFGNLCRSAIHDHGRQGTPRSATGMETPHD